jgi:DNA-binding transcriptional LysR family regulator
LQAAQAALEGLRDAEHALAARRSEPIGRVRIDLPAGFGRLLLPTLRGFRQSHPKVTLEIALSDRMSDAVAEGWDIVVRIGDLPVDSEMTVRKLCDLRLGLYASPDYLARKGAITSVADLNAHDAVIFRGPSGRLRGWSVLDGDVQRELSPNPSLALADGQALVEAAIVGLGIAQIFDRVAKPQVDAEKLVHILPASDVTGPPVHALIPLGQKMPSKTRAVLNHLAEYLRA